MRKRTRWQLLFAFFAATLALAAGVWYLWPRLAITPENARRIKNGMTDVEVKTILGGRPGDYRADPARVKYNYDFVHPRNAVCKEWVSDDALAVVAFTPDGRVAARFYLPLPRREQHEPILAKISRWLRL